MKWKIYEIKNLVNNKNYIGITQNSFKVRWANHKSSSKCPVMNAAIKKYGAENFFMTEIDSASSLGEALEKEAFYILEKNSLAINGQGYNITENPQAHLYTENLRFKIESSRKKNGKRIKNKTGIYSEYYGVSYNPKQKGWTFNIKRREKFFRGGFLDSDFDAAVARDIKLVLNFDKQDIFHILNFPENYDDYISGKITEPKKTMKNKKHIKRFPHVYFYERDGSWRTAIYKSKILLFSRGNFKTEEEAAECADWANLLLLKNNFKLNFPEKSKQYLSSDYEPPLTIFESNRKSPFANISYEKSRKKYYYRLTMQIGPLAIKPVFKTLKEALEARSRFVCENNLPSSIDRHDLIKLNNLDPKIWTLDP